MRRILTLVLLLAACAGGAVYAESYTASITVNDTGGTVTFDNLVSTVMIENVGAQDAYVRVFTECESVVAIAATIGAGRKRIQPSVVKGVTHDPKTECGIGYKGYAYKAVAGQTTTVEVEGK
jgi:hypothetical protein